MKYLSNLSLAFVLCYLLGLIACCKTEPTSTTTANDMVCNTVSFGFINKDYSKVKPLIDSFCLKYIPSTTQTDQLGHEINTELLIDELNELCPNLKVTLKCYACLESLPVQSSFIVELDSNNIQVNRHFRLYVPEGKVMYFNN